MFENILSQQQVITQLSEDVRSGSLPSAILFEGAEFGGKLSTALELARTLGCRESEAPWSCSCASCNAHRLLLEPRTILIGERYFMQEILVAESVLLRVRNEAAVYLYQRAVRKLARRFDALLWEGDEQRLEKSSGPLAKLGEALDQLLPGMELPADSALEKLCAAVQDVAKKLCELLPHDNIPVDVIRRVSSWSRMTAGEEPKVIIIENADRMQESSRNALLKTLEEPPSNTYFVLLSAHKRALMPTILSRVRPYHFHERTESEAGQILRRIFRDESEGSLTLSEYFVRTGFPGEMPLDQVANEFLELVCVREQSDVRGLLNRVEKQLKAAGDSEWTRRFLESLTHRLRGMWRDSLRAEQATPLNLAQLEKWTRTIEAHREYIEQYRLPTLQILEGLYFEMRG